MRIACERIKNILDIYNIKKRAIRPKKLKKQALKKAIEKEGQLANIKSFRIVSDFAKPELRNFRDIDFAILQLIIDLKAINCYYII